MAEVGVEEDEELGLAGVEAEAEEEAGAEEEAEAEAGWSVTAAEAVTDSDEPLVELTDAEAGIKVCEPSVTLAKAPAPILLVTDTSKLTLPLSSGHSIPSEAEFDVAAGAAEVTVTEATREPEWKIDSDSSAQSCSSKVVGDPCGMEVTYGSALVTTAEDSSGQSLIISEADVTAAAVAEVISAALVMIAEDGDPDTVSERASEVNFAEVPSGALVLGKRVRPSVSRNEEGGVFPMTIPTALISEITSTSSKDRYKHALTLHWEYER